MGGIFAKLDNQDKIISLERKSMGNVKDESSLNMDKLKEYYNKHGYLKVEINGTDMKNYVESYIKKYLKKSEKEIQNMTNAIGMHFTIGMILSNYGLFVLYEKPVEKFTNFEGFENNHYNGYESFGNVGLAVQQAKPEMLTVLIPKIYFSGERNNFIDFLIAGLPQKGTNINEQKQILSFAKKILDKINLTPNPEVKIANTIGLITRVNMLQFALNLIKTQYKPEESLEILSDLVNEHLDDIPSDECVFYNDKLNFIKFTPNICQKIKEEKELNLKKIYGTACPVQEEKACPVQEEKACPVQEEKACPVQEEKACPVQEEKVCPVQEQVACPKCGEQKCPEHVCPTCVKEECSKPEEPSNTWKYVSILLTIIVIVMVIMMIFKSSGTKPNVKNLSKLN